MKPLVLLPCLLLTLPALAQIRPLRQTPTTVSLQNPNVVQVKKLTEIPVAVGAYGASTPLTAAPADPAKNSTAFYHNALPNALNDKSDTRYFFIDNQRNGTENLLAFRTDGFPGSLRKIIRNTSNAVQGSGSYQINGDIKYGDELLKGEFSPAGGQSLLVVDRRGNQFWHYQKESSWGNNFVNPYSMLANWTPATRYATGDFNGDGKTDLLGWDHATNAFNIALYTPLPGSPMMPGTLQPAGTWLKGWAQTADMDLFTGDFNGDSRHDIALLHKPTGEWRVALSTGTAFAAATGYQSGVWLKPFGAGAGHTITAMDVNADGKCDLVDYDANTRSFQAVISNGQYFDYAFKRESIGTNIPKPEQVVFGKFEGKLLVAIGHELPPDNSYLFPRRAMSFYLASYAR